MRTAQTMTAAASRRVIPGLLGVVAALLASTGCTLRSEMTLSPLALKPSDTVRAANRVEDLVEVGDYPRALALASAVDAKPNATVAELNALGKAELVSGRLADAKRHFRQALVRKPFRDVYADIAWNLSQAELLDGEFAASLHWAQTAVEYGLEIRSWHLELLEALQTERPFVVGGVKDTEVPMEHRTPAIPRVEVRINEARVMGIIDSGAVMTIVSDRLAAEAKLRSLGDFTGTFYGLLGEPIQVRFAMIDSMTIGDLVIESVPVAIMAGEKMKFFTLNRTPFHIDLLLGANLLREFRLSLDFERNEVSFHHLDASEKVPATDQNLFILNAKPYVHGSLNGQGWFLYQLDTGSEITYLNSVEISRWKLQRNFAMMYRGAELQGLGGATKRGVMVDDVSVGIGAWQGTFKTLPLYSSEKSGAIGLIGENFLKHFRLTIDFGTMKILLDPPSRKNEE
ncbi:MAG: retroviral-like aspartic protease family protein [Acidobacteria bacterium]|nr:retroviral-like aspartic protease family protein [Acidobacteriota bacterium]